MKFDFSNLIFEVTRMCNMQCIHCLRGNSEDLFMSTDTVDAVLSHVSSISSITFTGGEPSLNIGLISYILDKVKEKDIPVYNFFLATNGKTNVEWLLSVCDQWFYYCAKCMELLPEGEVSYPHIQYLSDNQDVFYEYGKCLALSSDPYHDPIPVENVYKIISRSYFSPTKIQGFKYGLLARGRGEGIENSNYREIISELSFDETTIDELYVSSNGLLLADCDISFGNMPFYAVGDIVDNPNILEDLYKESKK